MTLESIYQISSTVLNIKERLESCVKDILREFNRKLEWFVVPDRPCLHVLKREDGGYVEFSRGVTSDEIMQDIQDRFNCLKAGYVTRYLNQPCQDPVALETRCFDSNDPHNCCIGGFLVPEFLSCGVGGGDCDNDSQCLGELVCGSHNCEREFGWTSGWAMHYSSCTYGRPYCNTNTCQYFKHVFHLRSDYIATPDGLVEPFDFQIPAVLPSRKIRSIWSDFLFNNNVTVKDLTAEDFIIEVFDEFVGCAVSSMVGDNDYDR